MAHTGEMSNTYGMVGWGMVWVLSEVITKYYVEREVRKWQSLTAKNVKR